MLQREEEHKILIVLSDGKPYDVILNRPNARNPKPYYGDYAIKDTGFAVRRLRNQGVCVLGVFAGEEKDYRQRRKFRKGFCLYTKYFRIFPCCRQIFNEAIGKKYLIIKKNSVILVEYV